MLYGLHLGPEKSLEWLTAFFSGFFLNAMIVQPARVLVLVLVLVLVFKARHTLKDLAPLGQLNTTERLLRKRQMLKRYSTMSTAWVGDLRFRSPLTGAQAKAILARLKVETEAKAMLRDLFMYTVFMVAVVVMTYGHMDVYYRYMQTKYTRELLVGAQSYVDEEEHSQWLEKIHYVSDIWDYLVDTLVPQLLPDQPELAQSYNSYLVGPIRVRQVRVEPDHSSCDSSFNVYGGLRNVFGHQFCTYSLNEGQEEKRSFNHTWSMPSSLPADEMQDSPYVYRSAEELRTLPFKGHHGWYPGGGYVTVLPRDNAQIAETILLELSKSDWIDQMTRCILVELTMYNPNVHLFTNVRLSFEFENYGGIFPMKSFFTSQLFHYTEEKKVWLQYAEAITVLCVVFYTFVEVKSMLRLGIRQYFSDIWNWTEILVLLVSYTSGLFFFLRYSARLEVFSLFRKYGHSRFIDFSLAFFRDEELQVSLGLLAALVIYKMLKIITFNPFLATFTHTIFLSRADCIGYSAMTAAYLVAFGIFGMLSFGSKLIGYYSFDRALLRLFFFIMGEPDFHKLVAANYAMGHLFFLSALFVTQYIIINFFIAILREWLNIARCLTYNEENATLAYMIQSLKLYLGLGPKNVRRITN